MAPAAEVSVSAEAALLGAIVTTVGLASAPITVQLVRRLVPGRNVFFARWGFSHVLVAALLAAGGALVAGWILARRPAHDPVALGLEAMAASSAVLVLVACVVLFWAQRLDPEGARSLGLRGEGSLRSAVVGLVAYVASWPILAGLYVAWPWLLTRMGESFEPQPYAEILAGLEGARLALALVLAVLVAPLCEELLFRGFLQPLLVQNFRDAGGLVLTSALFALLHGTSAFLPIFALSLVMGGVMLRTRSIAGPFAIHAFHNGASIAILLFAESAAGGTPGAL